MAWPAAKIAEVEERRAALIRLRRKRVSYEHPDILALGYSSPDAARKDFYRAVTARREATAAEVAGYREEQNVIYESIIDTYLPLALGSEEQPPDHKAGELVLKTLHQQARTNGWEEVLKAELTGPGGGPMQLKATAVANLIDLINTAGDEDEDDDTLGADPDDEDADDDGDPDQD